MNDETGVCLMCGKEGEIVFAVCAGCAGKMTARAHADARRRRQEAARARALSAVAAADRPDPESD